jgi:hypothetical protein
MDLPGMNVVAAYGRYVVKLALDHLAEILDMVWSVSHGIAENSDWLIYSLRFAK